MKQASAQSTAVRPRLAAGLLAVGLVLILGFSTILYLTFSSPRRLDASAYSLDVPEDILWQLDTREEDGRLIVEGWAIETSRYIESVEVYVVLYDAQSGVYYALPTALEQRWELPDLFENGSSGYVNGGFVASVRLSRLQKDVGEYELCIAFSQNQLDVLIHTGEVAA